MRNVAQSRKQQRIHDRHQAALAREHTRIMEVEKVLRDFESAHQQAYGITVQLHYKAGWVFCSGGWKARLSNVEQWIVELQALVHEKDIETGE